MRPTDARAGSGLLYVYGFASPEAAPCLAGPGRPKGIDGLGAVRALPVRASATPRGAAGSSRVGRYLAFVAVVSPVPEGHDLESIADARAAMAHELVLSACLEGGSVVPVRFGTVVERRELEKTMRRKAENILALLRDTEGCVEVGVKAIWKPSAFAAEIARIGRTDSRIAALREQAKRGSSAGETYRRALRAGEIVAAGLEEARSRLADRILEELTPACVRVQRNPPSGERMVLNAAFLVRKGREGEFDQAVNKACGGLTDSLDFVYSGPWPPYNFCTLEL